MTTFSDRIRALLDSTVIIPRVLDHGQHGLDLGFQLMKRDSA